jgi:hypothetical protein
MKKIHLLILVLAVILASCTKPAGYGELCVKIDYSINGKPLITDSLCYTNEAGNEFLITEIQWFLSRIELQDERGDWFRLNHKEVELPFSHTTDWVFYIDSNIPESQTLEIAPLPVGKYKTLRFTFGLNEEDNQSGLFSDPPESNMFWPEPLGGGYHYMKLNGKYLDENEELAPLNIHLGIGQNEDLTAFFQNYFTVELPIDFTILENAENQLDLTMIVDNWFRSPHRYDFNEWGSAIMQNQAAQQELKKNGNDVFRIEQGTDNQHDNNMATQQNEITWETVQSLMQKAAPKPHFWSWKSVKERWQDLRFKDSKFKI